MISTSTSTLSTNGYIAELCSSELILEQQAKAAKVRAKNKKASIKYGEEKYLNVVQMYQGGMSYREIARLFNKPPSTIYYYLKKQNTPMRKGKPFCLEKEKDKIIEEYKNGVSAAILCEKYNCNRTTITDLLKRNGITPNRNRTKRRTLFAFTSEIKSLYDQGKLYKDIAKKYGVDLSTISRFVKARGWSRPETNKVALLEGVKNA